jgi:hypothetical protein
VRIDEGITVHTLSGMPTFAAATALEREMRLEAGVSAYTSAGDRPSPTVFHIATGPDGTTLGVASTSVGELADLPMGLALLRSGVEVTDLSPLPGPVCELVSLAVDPSVRTEGVAEVLYRAFYRRARSSSSMSLAANIDPWLVDVLREQYGVAFRTIGPPVELMGRQLLPVGEELTLLEEAVEAADPAFHAFLTA